MTRRQIGRSVAEQLFAAESAIDDALAEAGALASLLPRARQDARLSAVAGHEAVAATAAGLGALTEARGQLVKAHLALAALAAQLGMNDLAVGPLDKPADRPPRKARLALIHSRRQSALTG
ncbi:hypothetical protein E4M02_00475 [Brevundimonas sp. S30B]|uniref:hypothetical protein n=1 Tax=unclassified Brevundimonas TaxID=2622653 RepID=UPI0010721C42|nr:MULTISPECIES: hypothetical protein [unclassified Brevundimonas]QBX37601.1 hypothetical protein E4M01_07345 [Brevundimonas sp. MF30-B]TFW03606.1 hypothetical protein E4M02_00475 [Brevundimonas sp. S30B]